MSFGRRFRLIRNASFGLALLYAILFAASAVILGFIVYWTVQASIDQQLAARIDAEIVLLRGELKEGPDELVREVQERVTFFDTLEYGLADADGKELVGNLPMPATLGWSDVALPNKQAPNSSDHLRVELVVLDNGFRLAVGDELGPKEDIRRAFLYALGWALLAFLILTLAGGVLLSSVFLRRVDAVVRTVEAIIEGDLNSRVPLRGTYDNFDRLSASLNRMLDRIQLLMESLSQVSNDIAHALRTPLGRLRQKLEEARASSRVNAKAARMIDAALIETDNILETFSALLRIAQIESGTRTAGFCELDLSALFETISEAYSAGAEDQGKTLTTNIAPSIRYWGDRDLLSEMVANIIDNAIRHTPQGSHIEVSLADRGSQLMASVSDNGPGVPEGARASILRRFYRLDSSINTPGVGLGLPLVAAVAELHGMRLTVGDNAPGLSVTIVFEPRFSDPRAGARRSISEVWKTEQRYSARQIQRVTQL